MREIGEGLEAIRARVRMAKRNWRAERFCGKTCDTGLVGKLIMDRDDEKSGT